MKPQTAVVMNLCCRLDYIKPWGPLEQISRVRRSLWFMASSRNSRNSDGAGGGDSDRSLIASRFPSFHDWRQTEDKQVVSKD